MITNLLIIAGAVVLSAALRSYHHPAPHRLGMLLLFFGVPFLIGWLFFENVWTGLALASLWLLLPWIEILTRARRLRLPEERPLEACNPPNSEQFPDLRDLSEEIESAGFEEVEDVRWEHEGQRQFYRLFLQPQSGTEASICLIEQDQISFYYIAVTSRARGGSTYLTWNYPFSYGLRPPPTLHLHRAPSETPFQALLADHRLFLDRERVGLDAIEPTSPEKIRERMQADLRAQIRHNLDKGVLKKDRAGMIRYSARGLLFLWCQFLRDLVRFS